MTSIIDMIAIELLAREDIADLHSTRDADELAHYLIMNAKGDIIPALVDMILDSPLTALHDSLIGMILNPND